MHTIQYTKFSYQTSTRPVSPLSKLIPSVLFYIHLTDIVFRASRKAKTGDYDDAGWIQSSFDVLTHLEKIGIKVEIAGIRNVLEQAGPVVFIGNHMSMMETLLLPVMIQPIKPVTFVVKESLLAYPVFKHIMRSRKPVAVSRTNPRQDLKVVMTEGQERLQNGISVIVFPQTTRSHSFSPEQMSSIGVKLAKKAGVPVIPLALKTDCWQNGRWFKDFGRLDTGKIAHFSFGKPIKVAGRGDEEQSFVNAYIEEELQRWSNKGI